MLCSQPVPGMGAPSLPHLPLSRHFPQWSRTAILTITNETAEDNYLVDAISAVGNAPQSDNPVSQHYVGPTCGGAIDTLPPLAPAPAPRPAPARPPAAPYQKPHNTLTLRKTPSEPQSANQSIPIASSGPKVEDRHYLNYTLVDEKSIYLCFCGYF
ncbi:unnamed protein product [Colias eurytheme]|nr:unnamed protein product [Colias eurytheme]